MTQQSQFEDKEFHLMNRQKQLEGRYKALNEQLDETILENSKLQKKINTHNKSFVGDSGSASNTTNNQTNVMESVELVRANYERDENKWNVEKLTINSKVQELEQALKNKEDEMKRREKLYQK